MKSFILKVVLTCYILVSLLSGMHANRVNSEVVNSEIKRNTLPKITSTIDIMEMYYRENIPEEYANAFIYYTRDCPEIRQEFYSIMVHESGNFKAFVNKNSNGSYDLGPSQLNTHNLKNKYFMELYSPKETTFIETKYTYYMVITINFYKDLVRKHGKEYAFYAYNGGEKCVALIKENNKDSRNRSLINNVTNYNNSVNSILENTRNEIGTYIYNYRMANNPKTNHFQVVNTVQFKKETLGNKILTKLTENINKLVNSKELYYIRRRNEFAELHREELKVNTHPIVRVLNIQFA